MPRMTFVITLFLMAGACLVMAFTSWPWLIGTVFFGVVGSMARTALKQEYDTEPSTASNKFIVISLLVTVLGIVLIFVLFPMK